MTSTPKASRAGDEGTDLLGPHLEAERAIEDLKVGHRVEGQDHAAVDHEEVAQWRDLEDRERAKRRRPVVEGRGPLRRTDLAIGRKVIQCPPPSARAQSHL
jgi:hypothetical protein